uniref:histidine protein methyltransferase 1 homolog n=1 Tax=Myxine glutinosa TaxID=7769 RepID=UPI00358EAC87
MAFCFNFPVEMDPDPVRASSTTSVERFEKNGKREEVLKKKEEAAWEILWPSETRKLLAGLSTHCYHLPCGLHLYWVQSEGETKLGKEAVVGSGPVDTKLAKEAVVGSGLVDTKLGKEAVVGSGPVDTKLGKEAVFGSGPVDTKLGKEAVVGSGPVDTKLGLEAVFGSGPVDTKLCKEAVVGSGPVDLCISSHKDLEREDSKKAEIGCEVGVEQNVRCTQDNLGSCGAKTKENVAKCFLDSGAGTQVWDVIPGVYEGGMAVWEGTRDLLAFLSSPVGRARHLLYGCRLLDMGCGLGLLGSFGLLCGAQQVHFQDYNREVLLRATIPTVLLNMKLLEPIDEPKASISLAGPQLGKKCLTEDELWDDLVSGHWLKESLEITRCPVESKDENTKRLRKKDEKSKIVKFANIDREEGTLGMETARPVDEMTQALPPSTGLLSHCRFFAGDWSAMAQLLVKEHYDVVLSAETMYRSSEFPALLGLLHDYLRPGGLALLTGKAYYFGTGGGTTGLADEARHWGFKVHTRPVPLPCGLRREVIILQKPSGLTD